MSTTCYATASQWTVGGPVGVPPGVGVVVNYALVDSTTGDNLPTDSYGQYFGTLTLAPMLTMRTQIQANIQAQEPDTPGLTFVWLY